ncbi:unnamed protein product [Rotaria magnacalcarata]|uniref:Uncharacterized protein n=1 Tax=Rotaria magnacalcarata TaxID=392030 RepID=A0A816ZSV7_9BILA|nr:unnamed protein product [Rotaria magnacalcarata]
MNTEHIDIPITLSPNYSGACTHASMTNEELLTLTDQQSCLINGKALFALKYRVIPCAVDKKHHPSVEKMILFCFNDDLSSTSPRAKSSEKHKEPGMYHTTSVMRFLVNDYKLDPNTFVYTWSYDVFHHKSNMSQIYIDLGNYLSVQFSSEFTSSANVDNPNNLEPDHENQAFDCFMHRPPALLRDGRLVIEHKFDKLSIENARRLCVELNIPGNEDDIHESISLAEIYARENASVETSSNDLGNGEATPKNKRRFRKTTKKPDTFFGFYS